MAKQDQLPNYPKEENLVIQETIPDDIPEWAIKAMANGCLFKEVFERINKLTAIINKYEMEAGFWE